MIGCHADVRHAPPDGLVAAVESLELTFPCGLDTREQSFKKFGVIYFPHVTLIGLDGTIAWQGDPLAQDFDAELEMALTEVPEAVEYVTDGQAAAISPFAEAAASGDYDTAIKGLIALVENVDTGVDVHGDAMAVLELMADQAESEFERIDELEDQQLFFECDELIASAGWMREFPVYAERLDDLLAARDPEQYTAGKSAGERYQRGRTHLRAGEVRKAKAEFTAVIEEFDATAYAELALRHLSQLR